MSSILMSDFVDPWSEKTKRPQATSHLYSTVNPSSPDSNLQSSFFLVDKDAAGVYRMRNGASWGESNMPTQTSPTYWLAETIIDNPDVLVAMALSDYNYVNPDQTFVVQPLDSLTGAPGEDGRLWGGIVVPRYLFRVPTVDGVQFNKVDLARLCEFYMLFGCESWPTLAQVRHSLFKNMLSTNSVTYNRDTGAWEIIAVEAFQKYFTNPDATEAGDYIVERLPYAFLEWYRLYKDNAAATDKGVVYQKIEEGTLQAKLHDIMTSERPSDELIKLSFKTRDSSSSAGTVFEVKPPKVSEVVDNVKPSGGQETGNTQVSRIPLPEEFQDPDEETLFITVATDTWNLKDAKPAAIAGTTQSHADNARRLSLALASHLTYERRQPSAISVDSAAKLLRNPIEAVDVTTAKAAVAKSKKKSSQAYGLKYESVAMISKDDVWHVKLTTLPDPKVRKYLDEAVISAITGTTRKELPQDVGKGLYNGNLVIHQALDSFAASDIAEALCFPVIEGDGEYAANQVYYRSTESLTAPFLISPSAGTDLSAEYLTCKSASCSYSRKSVLNSLEKDAEAEWQYAKQDAKTPSASVSESSFPWWIYVVIGLVLLLLLRRDDSSSNQQQGTQPGINLTVNVNSAAAPSAQSSVAEESAASAAPASARPAEVNTSEGGDSDSDDEELSPV